MSAQKKSEMTCRSVVLDDELDQWLRDVAEEADRSINQVIRLCIRRAKEQCRPVGIAAKNR